MGRVFRKLLTPLWVGAAVASVVGGCREHDSLCASDCSSTAVVDPRGEGGNATASPSQGGADAAAGAGASGGSNVPLEPVGCGDDADCADQLRCNGSERCEDGACQPGTELSCTMGTQCVELETVAECRFPEPSPWLVVLGAGAAFGLPVAELEKRSLFPLGERDVASGFSGFVFHYFSPDGRRLWLFSYHGSFRDASMLSVVLGAGLPGPMTPVHDLPTVGSFVSPVFSADSRHAFIEDEYSGLYLFDFSDQDPNEYRGRLLGVYEPDWYEEHGFCEDSDLLVASGRVEFENGEPSGRSAWLLDSGAGTEIRETELGVGNTYVSGSGKLIALVGEEGVELITCDRSLARTPLASGDWMDVSFVGGDKYVELRFFGDYQIFSIANPSAPVLVYSCSSCDVEWPFDGVIRVSGTTEDGLLELQGDAPLKPYLGEDPDAVPLSAELAERVVARGTDLYLLKAPEVIGAGGAGGAAGETSSEFGIVRGTDPDRVVPIVREGSSHAVGTLEWSDVDRGLAIVTRSSDSSDEVWLLRFAEPPFTEELVGSGKASALTATSPDRRGFVYWFKDWDTNELSEIVWQPFARGSQSVPLGVTGEPMFGPLPP